MKRYLTGLLIASVLTLTACTTSVPQQETAQLETLGATTASETTTAATEASNGEEGMSETTAVGEQENQVITLRTYLREKYSDAQSELTSEPDDYWTLNGTKLEQDSIVIAAENINTIRYYYDTKKYYYVDSEPAALNSHPDRDGYVEFERSDFQLSSVNYNVVLCESLSLTLKSSCNAAVMKNIRGNDHPIELAKDSEEYRIKGLHPGDRITIIINDKKGYVRITDGDYRYMQA